MRNAREKILFMARSTANSFPAKDIRPEDSTDLEELDDTVIADVLETRPSSRE